jgi:hypothetical protein
LWTNLGLADYLTGASNSRKRSRDSTLVQPLGDDAEVEDAGEKYKARNKMQAY